MAFTARYAGRCPGCKGSINVGDRITGVSGRYRHERCSRPASLGRDLARRPDYDYAGHLHHLDHDEVEYAQGLADGERYHAEKAVYGAALADRFAAQDEFNRYWKNGEDY